jgi:hypothetical protein
MSAKWSDISTEDQEQYELLTATARGVIVRARSTDPATPFSVYVEESNGVKHPAEQGFADLTEAKIWAESELPRIVGQQVGV